MDIQIDTYQCGETVITLDWNRIVVLGDIDTPELERACRDEEVMEVIYRVVVNRGNYHPAFHSSYISDSVRGLVLGGECIPVVREWMEKGNPKTKDLVSMLEFFGVTGIRLED